MSRIDELKRLTTKTAVICLIKLVNRKKERGREGERGRGGEMCQRDSSKRRVEDMDR